MGKQPLSPETEQTWGCSLRVQAAWHVSPSYVQTLPPYPQNTVPMSKLPDGNNPWHQLSSELCLGVVWAVLLGMGQFHPRDSSNSYAEQVFAGNCLGPVLLYWWSLREDLLIKWLLGTIRQAWLKAYGNYFQGTKGAACVGQHLWLSEDSWFVNQTIRCGIHCPVLVKRNIAGKFLDKSCLWPSSWCGCVSSYVFTGQAPGLHDWGKSGTTPSSGNAD